MRWCIKRDRPTNFSQVTRSLFETVVIALIKIPKIWLISRI